MILFETTHTLKSIVPEKGNYESYYDENERVFATSISVEQWKKKPFIGDTITLKIGDSDEISPIPVVLINGEEVYNVSENRKYVSRTVILKSGVKIKVTQEEANELSKIVGKLRKYAWDFVDTEDVDKVFLGSEIAAII